MSFLRNAHFSVKKNIATTGKSVGSSFLRMVALTCLCASCQPVSGSRHYFKVVVDKWRTLMFQLNKFVQTFKDLKIIYLHSQFAIYIFAM